MSGCSENTPKHQVYAISIIASCITHIHAQKQHHLSVYADRIILYFANDLAHSQNPISYILITLYIK